jgi:hypothetical protein
MPTSGHVGKVAAGFVVKKLAESTSFTHVVDVGPGSGTYRAVLERVLPGLAWTAIEIWEPYVRSYRLERRYDEVRVADVREVDFLQFGPGGLIILGDVVEHMPKDAAVRVVESALDRFSMALVSLPVGQWPQGEVGGNPFEAHVASWSLDDAKRLFPSFAGLHYAPIGANGIAMVFVAREPALRAKLEEALTSLARVEAACPLLLGVDLPFCPDYWDREVLDRIHDRIDRALSFAGRDFPTGARAIFRNIYLTSGWGKGETRSGGGSSMAHTALLRRELGAWIGRTAVRSVADAGCGEANWQEVMRKCFGFYVGYDIVPEIVRRNQEVHGGANFLFGEADITRTLLPRFDAILCRHVLTHWSVEEARAAISLFRRSGARYLLATSYEGASPSEASTGAWRPVDLTKAPWRLGKPLEWLKDSPNGTYRLGVWALNPDRKETKRKTTRR